MVDRLENLRVVYYWDDGKPPRVVDDVLKYGVHGIRRGTHRPNKVEVLLVGKTSKTLTAVGKGYLKEFMFSNLPAALQRGCTTKTSIIVHRDVVNATGISAEYAQQLVTIKDTKW